MNRFESLATPGVRCLRAYQPGKSIEELQREYGINEVIKLASNENPLGPGERVRAALAAGVTGLERYPDSNGFALKQALVAHHDVTMSQITLGSGSSEVLELVVRVFAQPGDEVLFSEHAFAMYPIITQAVGATAVVALAKDWSHDLDAMRAAVTERTRVIFIANPNNPTGTWLGATALETFIADVPDEVIVVVDEAYFEYASELAPSAAAGYPDASQWLGRYPNLVVTRTFSKAYGLAGLRVGYSLSHPDLADLLNRVRPPFNLNSLTLVAARSALEDTAHIERTVVLNREEMVRVTVGMRNLALDFIPSVGNFVCVDVGDDAAAMYDALLHAGVIVRPVANYGMPRHLRVTLGLSTENERFLAALAQVLTS